MIVRETEPVILIGGASLPEGQVNHVLRLARVVIAADSGADSALQHGITPQAVIGDFDSISQSARAAIPEAAQFPDPDQDTTDFEKCLRAIAAPLILGLGFCGDRMDHQLAACTALARHPWQRCILLGERDLMFLCPPSLNLPLPEGVRVSLFPMGAVEGVSQGLKWPIGGLNLAPDGRIATSNAALGPVHLAVTAPKLLVILPLEMLDMTVGALRATQAYWPSPGKEGDRA
ncbi:thiamine diphosphokinase [Roseovarius mucosus]|uniref:thiamine diphosphokinase n=1 Tax=Roseovarius mucosus TaxID=215743 RepID=UPI0035D082AD